MSLRQQFKEQPIKTVAAVLAIVSMMCAGGFAVDSRYAKAGIEDVLFNGQIMQQIGTTEDQIFAIELKEQFNTADQVDKAMKNRLIRKKGDLQKQIRKD